MRFLGTVLLLAGYVLVYASVAADGRFATDPWKGLFADAYTNSVVLPTIAQTKQGITPDQTLNNSNTA